jgi:hypothetical protein
MVVLGSPLLLRPGFQGVQAHSNVFPAIVVCFDKFCNLFIMKVGADMIRLRNTLMPTVQSLMETAGREEGP